jgi:cytochrome c biogenesis protein CcdA
MKKLLFILFAFSFSLLNAQIVENPVTWSWETEKISDTEYKLIYNATIEEGWHLYSAHVDPDVGPYPTAFYYDTIPNFIFKGKVEETEPHVEYDPNFEAELAFFSNKAQFWQYITVPAGKEFTVKGEIEWMVCNDEMCMPPEYKDFTFTITPLAPLAESANSLTAISEVKSNTGQGILANPVTWTWETEKVSETEYKLIYNATIKEGWHLYSAHVDPDAGPYPTAFYYDTIPNFDWKGGVEETEPHVEYDPNFEAELAFFSTKAQYWQYITVSPGSPFTIKGEIEWMVCNDEMCMPPELKDFTFEITPPDGEAIAATKLDKDGRTMNMSFWTIFIEGFLGGIVALIMPCIFPMIPLTVSFFTKQSKTKSEGVRKAVIYGVSIITIYVLLGMFVSVAFGADALNAFATNPWVNFGFFVLFVIFAISFFGAFEITLPSSWVNKADEASNKGGLVGIFFMAFTLSLVSFSCTGPIIGSLLVEAGTQGNWMGPIIGMFGFSLALAIPFTLFAVFPGWLNSLPKSGGWLNTVKVVLGFLELAFAFKFLSSADLIWKTHWLERELFIAIWVAIAFLIVLYLLGMFIMPLDSKQDRVSVPRLLFAMVFSIMGFYMLPGIWGAPVKLISGFPPPEFYSESPGGAFNGGGGGHAAVNPDAADFEFGESCPHGMNCFNDFDEGLKYAKKVDKPVLIDFTGWGCVNCRKMEENVWVDPMVNKIINEEYVLVSLYVDDRDKLPKDQQGISETTGKKIKTVGNKWSDFQASNFNANAQPFYVVVGHDNLDPLITTRAFDLDIKAYKDWLKSGIAAFK